MIYEYFNTVLSNAEDEKIRHNRMGMMQAINSLQQQRADLSELAGF